jgi:hypothetical protein
MHLIQCLAFSNKINNVKDKFDNVLSKKKDKNDNISNFISVLHLQ